MGNNYDSVADLYDAYVRVDFDLAFFQELARNSAGPILELMAGTGRVTPALHQGRSGLTSVDLSRRMLRVLRRKHECLEPPPWVVCADVRRLPLDGDRFDLAVIPFNSFSELTGRQDQQSCLSEVSRVLAPGGVFICTLHNPEVRRNTLDGQAREHGPFELDDGLSLRLSVRGTVDDETGIAASEQTCRLFDESGALHSERRQTVRFALLTRSAFAERAEDAGLEVVELLGDYDGSPYSKDSPYMIWRARRRG